MKAAPLVGKRILITRPREQSAEFAALLELLGADAIEAPMIRILPSDDFGPLDAACARIREFDWIVFTSANAVDPFVDRLLRSPHDLRALAGARICAVGHATAHRLANRGLKADLIPSESRAESVADAILKSGQIAGLRVLMPRGDIARDLVKRQLEARGTLIEDPIAYRTVPAELEPDGGPNIVRLLLERKLDVVTFTSPSAVKNFVALVGAEHAAELLRKTVVASIGPVTAEAAAERHITTAIMPVEYTVPALVQAIVQHFAAAEAATSNSTERRS